MIRLLKIIGGVAGGLVAACLLIELLLRVVGYENIVLDNADPLLGNAGRPYASGIESTEGRTFLALNSLGHHDDEHRQSKPSDTFRIVLLGDSFSAAHQVPRDAMAATLLAKDLESCAPLHGQHVEVINFAYDGFDLRHHFLLMRDRVSSWHPDLVMIEMQPLYGMSGFLHTGGSSYMPDVDVVDGKVVVNADFQFSRTYEFKSTSAYRRFMAWSDHSRLVQYLMELQFKLRNPALVATKSEDTLTPAWQSAVDHAMRVLAATDGLAHAQGVPLVVALATRDMSMDPALSDAMRADPLSEEVRTRVSALGLPVMNIESELRHIVDERHIYLHGFGGAETGRGHWNREGNRAAADAYARQLCGFLVDGTIARGVARAPAPSPGKSDQAGSPTPGPSSPTLPVGG